MTDEYQFTNHAESTLAAALGGGDTSFAVAAGEGALFPSVSAGDGKTFRILVKEGATEEWMTVTVRSTDTLTVTRIGSESFSAGAYVYHRLDATALATMIQKGFYRTNDGSPDGSLAASYAGEEVLDSTNIEWYKHITGTTWKKMSS
jgi:hypothetical protein